MPVNSPLDLGQLRSALQSAGTPWQSATTEMTMLSEEERVVRLGVPLPDDIDADAVDQRAEVASAAAQAAMADGVGAPAAFDLRNVSGVNYSTPVKNQGNCGSCVAFGVAATMESVARYTRRNAALTVDLSEAHLFYCYGRNAGARCDSGWWPDEALNSARDSGVTFENYYPYTSGDQACSGLNADWPNHMAKVPGYQFMNGSVAAMKEAISTYGAIETCMVVFQDFYSYSTGVYRHVTGGIAGGHCVSLIGYSDAEGCWIGKNSWGTGWGTGGYFKIAYGQCDIESYRKGRDGPIMTLGIQGVNFRTWWPNQLITGLWTNEADNNCWAHGSISGWLKLDGAAAPAGQGMLLELAAAKAGARQVGIFETNGQVSRLYAW